MKALCTVIVLLALFPVTGIACSLVTSPEFDLRATKGGTSYPPQLRLRGVVFVPWISTDNNEDSCNGGGFIKIVVPSLRSPGVGEYGVIIRAKSGVNDTRMFPTYPLTPIQIGKGEIAIWWPWTGITPDADRKVRWRLELIPVSRSGVAGKPVSICVASDGSCPRLRYEGP